jgi:hypothetical protein
LDLRVEPVVFQAGAKRSNGLFNRIGMNGHSFKMLELIQRHKNGPGDD